MNSDSGFADFLPLFQETTESIQARIEADLNAGVDPNDRAFLDTAEGSVLHAFYKAMVLEFERQWDALATEVAAAMFPTFSWGDYLDEWGEALATERKAAVAATGVITFTGEVGTLIAIGTEVTIEQPDPDIMPPTFETTESGTIPAGGTLDLAVAAAEAGADGNVGAGAISILLSPNDGVTAVTNAAATTGGADVESDELYRLRLLVVLARPRGAGNQADYERWATAYPGVGHVTVQPVWDGPGTVQVVVTDAERQPVSAAVLNGLQAYLDPTPGAGAGAAPIGAIVTVTTPTLVPIAIAATVVFSAGYSLDGAGNTIACQDMIEQALTDYFNSLEAGSTVYIRHVEAHFFSIGDVVLDVTGLTLDAGTSNIAMDPLELASIGVVTLA